MDDTEQHHWTKMFTNPFAHKVQIGMLLVEGMEIVKKSHLIGEPTKRIAPKVRRWLFDASFVEAKLERDFLKPLYCQNLSELQERIDKAKQVQKDALCTSLNCIETSRESLPISQEETP